MTPTEILCAWEGGADLVKVFPASLFGPEYIKALRGPLPQVRLAPTGGISTENAAGFIGAGADVLCVGGTLVDGQAVETGSWDVLTARAREFRACLLKARAGRAT
jgi:2-dehydro-3-deoxyphosphogluconate aldolase/(4S)-4-hydroxy-2-oxoglutarate aldolase